MRKIYPILLLAALFHAGSPVFGQAGEDRKALEEFLSLAIDLSERLFFQGRFDEARKYVTADRFEDFSWFDTTDRIRLASQFFKIELFRNTLSQDEDAQAGVLRGLLRLSPAVHDVGDGSVRGAYLSALASAYLCNSNLDSADVFYREALCEFDRIGDGYRAAEARALRTLVRQHRYRRDGLHDRMMTLLPVYEEEIAFATQAGNPMALAYNLRHLGRIYREQVGDLGRAVELYESSLRCREEIGFKIYLPPSYSSMGDLHAALGNRDRGIAYYEQAIASADEVDFIRYRIHPRIRLGDMYHAIGEPGKAAEYYEEALRIARFKHYEPGAGEARERLSGAHFRAEREKNQ